MMEKVLVDDEAEVFSVSRDVYLYRRCLLLHGYLQEDAETAL